MNALKVLWAEIPADEDAEPLHVIQHKNLTAFTGPARKLRTILNRDAVVSHDELPEHVRRWLLEGCLSNELTARVTDLSALGEDVSEQVCIYGIMCRSGLLIQLWQERFGSESIQLSLFDDREVQS